MAADPSTLRRRAVTLGAPLALGLLEIGHPALACLAFLLASAWVEFAGKPNAGAGR